MINSCQICNILFKSKRTLNAHLFNDHQLKPKEYYDKFIKKESEGFCGFCNKQTGFRNTTYGYKKMCSRKCYDLLLLTDERKQKISISTKKAMQRNDVKENVKKHHDKGVSDETRKKMSVLAKRKFIDHPDIKEKMYTKERNKKISLAKEKYWKEHPEAKIRVGNMWKVEKEKDEVKWKRRLLDASKKGFEKIYSPNGESTLEIKLYNFLSNNNIKYEKQYELDGKLFDAYLTEYNILLEFDGEFWHKSSLEECMYDFQKESFHNDAIKNSIAKNHNISIYRIRENDDPSIILDILSKHLKYN